MIPTIGLSYSGAVKSPAESTNGGCLSDTGSASLCSRSCTSEEMGTDNSGLTLGHVQLFPCKHKHKHAAARQVPILRINR